MQYLSLDDWKIAAHLPIAAGEMMLSRIRDYGWIEIQGEAEGEEGGTTKRWPLRQKEI
jgi:hypothetical protein